MRAFYTRCSDYDNDGTFRANDLTNMIRYFTRLLPVAPHIAGRRRLVHFGAREDAAGEGRHPKQQRVSLQRVEELPGFKG
eukprot:3850463-Prymnesium_polylepis.1